jgi:predicted transposase/invertase (TIGR01784 family)
LPINKRQFVLRITDVSFLNPIQDPDTLAKKQSIIDVLCKDQEGKQYIIEMQIARASGFEERAQYYAAKAYTSQMIKGGMYEKLKEVIFIAILDYELFPNKEHYQSNHTIRDEKTNEHDLKGFRFIFIELPHFKKKLEELESMMEKWCYFFKHAPETTQEELRQLTEDEPIIQEAYEAVDRYGWNEQELMRYEQETKSEMDALALLRHSEEQGRVQGKIEGKIEVAKKMKAAGMNNEVIQEITGLSLVAIKRA